MAKTSLPRCWLGGRRLRAVAVALSVCCCSATLAQSLPAPIDEGSGTAMARVDLSAMSPAQRAELRARYRSWRELGDHERAQLRQAQARFAALPPEQQRTLRSRFEAMDRLHRDGWRLGPALGAHYPQLQALFGYVPPAQRESLIGLLHGLDPEQLQQLAILSQRTPPQDRDELRRALLAQTPAARAAWLQRQLGR